MIETAPRQMTARQFAELPEGPPYPQLIEGELIMSPTPNRRHQDIGLELAVFIRTYLKSNPIGSLHIAPSDVQISDLNVFNPDLYYVSKERSHILTKQGATGAPDLVVEILSPGTSRYDKGAKRDVYAREGVREMWLVDPKRNEVAVYKFAENSAPIRTVSESEVLTTDLLPGLEIKLAEIFNVE